MKDLPLSAHFALSEFVRSQVATRFGIDNTPDAQTVENLARLCVTALEPVRAAFGGVVMTIDSGFRAPRVNALVGGAATSYHLYGCAADVLIAGVSPLSVCQKLQGLHLPGLGKVIFEGAWTHIQVPLPGGHPRGEYWTARFAAGSVSYIQGINA